MLKSKAFIKFKVGTQYSVVWNRSYKILSMSQIPVVSYFRDHYNLTDQWAPQALKNDGKMLKVIWNTYTIVPVQILQTQHGKAQLSFSLWCFIKNNWPNDKSPCCTAISSAVVTVIGKGLGREKKVTLPNKEEGWLQAPLLNINI